MSEKPKLDILLCAPRGFCAGVDRAIQIVDIALQKYGAPVYVRHEIVHNKYVVDGLKAKGAIFVEELSEIPSGTNAPVIFSAHGVARSVPLDAAQRNMFILDATCPLVTKVHVEAKRHADADHEIILIGHRGHPEVIGTMGQLPEGKITLIETIEDAEAYIPQDPENIALVTQTTLSVDDTSAIIMVLRSRFPNINIPAKEDICYATTNRQEAVKAVAPRVDAMLVVGAPYSSNSMRLVEVAARFGCQTSMLVQRATDIDWDALTDIKTIGITAGASAPEILVEEVIDALSTRYNVNVEIAVTAEEKIAFNIPRILREMETSFGR